MENAWLPVSIELSIIAFLFSSLHGSLLLGLSMPRWRYTVIFWLYIYYQLMTANTLVATTIILFGGGTFRDLVIVVVVPWITWYNAYRYVEKDQKARDLERAADRRGEARNGRGDRTPPNGHQAGHQADLDMLLDPNGLYLLVPSHNHQPMNELHFWELDLDIWRDMARTSKEISESIRKIMIAIFGRAAYEPWD